MTVDEGESGNRTARLTFSLSSAHSSDVTVNYASADGSATVADGDYAGKSGTVTFLAGQTSKPVDLIVKADKKAELNQNFKVVLSSPSAGTIADNTRRVTIRTDD